MTNKELLNKIIEVFDGTIIDEYGWEHFKIEGKPYDICFDAGRLDWTCDCKAFIFRRKFRKRYCKHILQIQEEVMNRRIAQSKMKQRQSSNI